MEIAGLKNFVQDDVNKLIAGFVGFKPHPLALIVGVQIRHWKRHICEQVGPLYYNLALDDSNFVDYWRDFELDEIDSDEDE